jgi:hypothetical protein
VATPDASIRARSSTWTAAVVSLRDCAAREATTTSSHAPAPSTQVVSTGRSSAGSSATSGTSSGTEAASTGATSSEASMP